MYANNYNYPFEELGLTQLGIFFLVQKLNKKYQCDIFPMYRIYDFNSPQLLKG